MKITDIDRADVRELLPRLETSTLPEPAIALEAPVHCCRVQIDGSGRSRSTGTVADPGPPPQQATGKSAANRAGPI